ncbi:MAG: glycosyltransferase family protein [Bacteroidota bacterium]
MANFLFIVQGEGKGHMTQAIALYEMLIENGHEVVATMVGVANGRKIPNFYTQAIDAPIITFESPSLFYGKGKAPNMLRTILSQTIKAKQFFKNADKVHQVVSQYEPDIIINFYEMAAGFYNFFYRPTIPIICVGHQYLLLHNHFINIKNKKFDRYLLQLNTRMTAIGAAKKLALSFYPLPNDDKENINVVPPLLRKQVKEKFIENEKFILAYVTHHKIVEDLIDWHSKNNHQTIHCFIDKKSLKSSLQFNDNFFIHQIDSDHFLDKMAQCEALVCTAGFESVCEAMYMGKPVMMVPVKNHIEQRINAHDGEKAGAGIYCKSFKINRLIKYLPSHIDKTEQFVEWERNAENLFLENILTVLENSKHKKVVNNPISKPNYSVVRLLKEVFKKKSYKLSID